MRNPDDEQSWNKLEQLRRAVELSILEEEVVELQEDEEINALARAIEGCKSVRQHLCRR